VGLKVQPFELSLREASSQIKAKRLSPLELTDSVLGRIEATEHAVSAFAHVTREIAQASAKLAASEIAVGRYRGPLHGIPVSFKDNYDAAGVLATSSSMVRASHVPPADAAVVAKLGAAGMVMVGKTFAHEFAYGVTTPTTRNPWDATRIPGGSSGGSAAAVASGAGVVSMGTDTGGSVRIPASLCGAVGLKPTFGRVSRRGITPLSWSLDHPGPISRNVEDCAFVMNAIAGFDPLEPTTVRKPVADFVADLERPISGLRIGVPKNYFFEQVDDEVAVAVTRALGVLESLGAKLVEVDVPHTDAVMPAVFCILVCEASAYHQQSLRSSADLYGPDIRVLLEAGELMLATDYIKAMRVRTVVQGAWAEMFRDIDVLAAPSTPIVAPEVGTLSVTWSDELTEDVLMALPRLTQAANLTGLPALSLPVGFSSAGLPIGLQLVGRPFDEGTILRAGHAYERESDSDQRLPLL
jgi:aspartyl-tRNA(Asn)/glutamyl-tRNA(Gln) amidotransferase subunit A